MRDSIHCLFGLHTLASRLYVFLLSVLFLPILGSSIFFFRLDSNKTFSNRLIEDSAYLKFAQVDSHWLIRFTCFSRLDHALVFSCDRRFDFARAGLLIMFSFRLAFCSSSTYWLDRLAELVKLPRQGHFCWLVTQLIGALYLLGVDWFLDI